MTHEMFLCHIIWWIIFRLVSKPSGEETLQPAPKQKFNFSLTEIQTLACSSSSNLNSNQYSCHCDIHGEWLLSSSLSKYEILEQEGWTR